jgi:hypothetical protein
MNGTLKTKNGNSLQFQGKIYDEDIANYYHKLMEQTSLDKMDTD